MRQDIIFIIVSFICLSLFNTIEAETYKLDDLINIAMEQANTLQIENIQKTISDKYYNKALYDFLPSANYNLSATDGTMGHQYSSTLAISKSIALNEPTYFNLKKSIIDKKNNELALEDKKKELALTIFSLYVDILQTQKNIEILSENFDLQKKIYEQVNIQYQNNKKTIYDIQASQIDTLTAMTDLLEFNKNLFSKRQDLFQVLGIEDLGFEFEDIDQVESQDIDQFSDNITIQISENKLKQNMLSLTQSRLSLLPNIYVSYSYNLGVTDKESEPIFKPKEYQDSYTYGIHFSYPIFNFLDRGAEYNIQKRQTQIIEINHKDLVDKQNVRFQQALNDLKIYQQSYEIYRQKLDLSTTHLEIAQKRFEMGLINMLDLDKSRIQYLEAQLSMNSKYYSLLKKQQEINYLKSGKVLGKW
ncbi:MAG: TolC family protein [Candidatus Cloacimonetes bacterium]|nr:TolC family protein [Candidatus Cloacimonadota bacterium]